MNFAPCFFRTLPTNSATPHPLHKQTSLARATLLCLPVRSLWNRRLLPRSVEAVLLSVLVILKEDLDLIVHLLANVLATKGSYTLVSIKPTRQEQQEYRYLTDNPKDSEG